MKPPAIYPVCHPHTGRLELSVYRDAGLSIGEVWNLCSKHVDNAQQGRVAKARGITKASVFLREDLSFEADGVPHDRHANVIGWRQYMAKHELKIVQQRIAASMTLELREDS